MYKTAVELRLNDRILRVPGFDNPSTGFERSDLSTRVPIVVYVKLDVETGMVNVGVVLPNADPMRFPIPLQGWPDAERTFYPNDVFTLM